MQASASQGRVVRANVGARVGGGARHAVVRRSAPPGLTAPLIPGYDDYLAIPDIRDVLTPRPSPFAVHNYFGGGFVDDGDRVALSSIQFASGTSAGACGTSTAVLNDEGTQQSVNWMEASLEQLVTPLPPWAIRAGARATIFHDPKQTTAAIVTCGGLCPGLNDVVAVGFYDKEHKPIVLTKESVDGIQLQGGTILGTSRGGANIKEIVKRIDMWGVDMLFVVGGNGGNAGANAIQQKCAESDVACNVIGIPKSIDNDILLIDKCFGFDTAVEEAQRALLAAHVEASSARNGIGLVKLMGRQSGFIAMQASMAAGVVDAVLIPEVPFKLEGPGGLLAYLGGVLESKGHAVVCLAEGAGQDILDDHTNGGTDASGNPILKDIGHPKPHV
ncbi:hypothetical protein MNEG_5364 [Monoraphidium neglectum]|uniref:Phosphofructokinase domain-containing protein n=1 Tax=Monoraphidium neglectum TaxID=145388 RepID=A0A0D2MQ81_9CHLO|nr:hypothetical protein MNEG_5364 [Monoraphidium neglectum]KIZ02592.1 hypothetical protein MNEG_5364 [Monoraphidium neglectum]|eukprot:XP_013901611.1 hypothetical protein MNEG_5364 [Monoraphidium neglectum]